MSYLAPIVAILIITSQQLMPFRLMTFGQVGYRITISRFCIGTGRSGRSRRLPGVHGDSADISALATNSVWAITQGGTIHWDGSAWSTVLVPPMYTGTTTSIEGIGPDDVWVGGAFVNNQPFSSSTGMAFIGLL